MKKPFYLLSALGLITFTILTAPTFDRDSEMASSVLRSSVLDAGRISDTVVVALDNPELNSYAANPGEYEDEINKNSAVKADNVVTKKIKKNVRLTASSDKETKTVKNTRTVAVSDTENANDDVKLKAENDVCTLPTLGTDIAKYDAQIITVRKKFKFDLNEEFKVKVYVKNAGNTPWFSPDSKCEGTRVYLGTTRDDGRFSQFYTSNDNKYTGWATRNKVRMDEGNLRVEPGEIASFTFYAKADSENSIFREYFAPQLDDGTYLKNAEFKVDIYSGENDENDEATRTKLFYAYRSMDIDEIDADGEKSIEVDLSEQKMALKIDNYVVREFKVSSGKSSTPTPKGTFKVMEKNEVRVGAASPHYIMPYFQRLTAGGVGLHALPSLGNDGDTFWTEAKEHIGTPVSHGCVRMLPEDAEAAFAFTDIGDSVEVHW